MDGQIGANGLPVLRAVTLEFKHAHALAQTPLQQFLKGGVRALLLRLKFAAQVGVTVRVFSVKVRLAEKVIKYIPANHRAW